MRIGWKTSMNAGHTLEELIEILDQSDLREKYELKADLFDLLVSNKI